MKRLLLPFLLVLLLCAGCKLFNDNDGFVGTWVGHGEGEDLSENVWTLDDVVAFHQDGTFTLDQVLRVYDVDGHLVLNGFQRGAGTYTVSGEDTGTLAMAFDDSSDPGLQDDEMVFTFSEDHQQVTIDPTTIDFLIYFDRVD